jgi:hypothetical protein
MVSRPIIYIPVRYRVAPAQYSGESVRIFSVGEAPTRYEKPT